MEIIAVNWHIQENWEGSKFIHMMEGNCKEANVYALIAVNAPIIGVHLYTITDYMRLRC